MAVIAWTEIEALYNVRKYSAAHPEILNGNSVVHYRPKVKLHGTNAAVQCHADGRIIAQSRTNELFAAQVIAGTAFPGNDNAGFARWVKDNETLWQDTRDNARSDVIIFGEWIGPGIQKGVAVSEIPKKCFAVFAARPLADGLPLGDELWVDPSILQELVAGIPDTYVLPWYNEGIELDWSKTAEELMVRATEINQWVGEVEANDPWVEATFNVKGTGEGLVFYPTSKDHLGLANFNNLVFKAKGEKHKNIKTASPAQLAPEAAASINGFVDMVLTDARLEQGVRVVAGELNFDARNTGNFVKWICEDVKKETQDELEASKLEWKQVQKPLSEKARNWFLSQARI